VRTDLAEFWRILEDATIVRADPTGRYYFVHHPDLGSGLYQRGEEAAFLLARGAEAWERCREFDVPCPLCGGSGTIRHTPIRFVGRDGHAFTLEETACPECAEREATERLWPGSC